MQKKILLSIAVLVVATNLATAKAAAQESVTNIHLFTAKGCPHCAQEKEFLNKWAAQDPTIAVIEYEVTKHKDNEILFVKVGEALDASISGVPFTVVGDTYISGYANNETSGEAIKKLSTMAREQNLPDLVTQIKTNIGYTPAKENSPTKLNVSSLEGLVKGINFENLSLPAISIVLGLADGFNPCAMWVLLFLIGLLLGLDNKKRRWLLGITFIVASGAVYFLFMTAWLNIFLVVGYVRWFQILIGSVALFAGYSSLKKYFCDNTGGCKVVGANEDRQKVFARLRQFVAKDSLLLALFGIISLALAVNAIELFCSAGIPAVFTGLLSQAALPTWKYYMYLFLYIVFFVIDDLIVFLIAMLTLQLTGIESRYAKYAHIIGGILMLVIGILMLLKPELLMLG